MCWEENEVNAEDVGFWVARDDVRENGSGPVELDVELMSWMPENKPLPPLEADCPWTRAVQMHG